MTEAISTSFIKSLEIIRTISGTDAPTTMKEAQLRFEFVRDENNNPIKLVTYNTNGKDAEWIKAK
jgi:hypothetical protein